MLFLTLIHSLIVNPLLLLSLIHALLQQQYPLHQFQLLNKVAITLVIVLVQHQERPVHGLVC